jgi:hypothetical protein
MSEQNQKTQTCYLVAQTPKTPKALLLSSIFPIGFCILFLLASKYANNKRFIDPLSARVLQHRFATPKLAKPPLNQTGQPSTSSPAKPS